MMLSARTSMRHCCLSLGDQNFPAAVEEARTLVSCAVHRSCLSEPVNSEEHLHLQDQ